jgi:hypothetical protein
MALLLNPEQEKEPISEETIFFGDTLLNYEELTEQRNENRLISSMATSPSECQQDAVTFH